MAPSDNPVRMVPQQKGWLPYSRRGSGFTCFLVLSFMILFTFDIVFASSTSSAFSSDPASTNLSSSSKSSSSSSTARTTFQARQSDGDKSGSSGDKEGQVELLSDQTASTIELLTPSLLQAAPGVEVYSPRGWQLSSSFPGISMQHDNASRALSLFRGNFVYKFSGLLSGQSQGILLRISRSDHGDYSQTLPRLEISVDLPKREIVLRYLGSRSFQRMALDHALPENRWMDLQISVHGKDVKVTVDCKSTSTYRLRQTIGAFPQNGMISFGTKGEDQQGLQGIVFSGMLFTATHTAPHECDVNPGTAGAVENANIQSDEQYGEQRLVILEQKFVELRLIVEKLQEQNQDLRDRVSHLETCECRPSCSHNGTVFQNGESWNPEPCTLCTCVVSGLPS
ncbi:kielin/chordin-like protein [Plakobranchus ocellatus]|uniref:Kielin/chordin-like protein n=1 Tax=Plakobranchus ocellatus TaxID=259542 RepID=A0AAV3YWT9_9GAST|nr:kielin/chordin-like protein [Plakobranchus ocellatus]